MILHLLRNPRDVNRNVFNDLKHVSATTALYVNNADLFRESQRNTNIIVVTKLEEV